jgi:hypothetical protein
MKWTSVESSALQAAAYAGSRAWLYLLFRSGEVYRYFDVPEWQYQEFLAADSKGRYFGRKIRGHFRYERMRRLRCTIVAAKNFS